jgi:16S rRNA (uracil1498-N3)-methyltransferase
MRIPRIYHPDTLTIDQEVPLSTDAANHLSNVLRLKAGHPVVLFNGDDNEYSSQLIEVGKRKVVALIEAKLAISVESPLPIHLGQGISRGDRMELVIQKAVELGVTEITPIITDRCTVKLNQQRWEKKHQQWQKIAIAACEQCGRNTLPRLHSPMQLVDWTRQSTQQLRVTLHPKAETSFRHIRVPAQGVRLLIGPEGGFTDAEVYATEQGGFKTVQLGPRILRTETAALASITALQSIYGDL